MRQRGGFERVVSRVIVEFAFAVENALASGYRFSVDAMVELCVPPGPVPAWPKQATEAISRPAPQERERKGETCIKATGIYAIRPFFVARRLDYNQATIAISPPAIR
jgi:hypothetical protein